MVDRPAEIAVASSARTRVAYLPHRTSFSYANKSDVLCWIDPRTGDIRPVGGGTGAIRSPDAGDWLFVAEKTARICAGVSL